MSSTDFKKSFWGYCKSLQKTRFSSVVMFLAQVTLTKVLNLVGMMDIDLFVPARMKPLELLSCMGR